MSDERIIELIDKFCGPDSHVTGAGIVDLLDGLGYEIVKRGPDPLDEVLNSGDGVYRP